MTLRRQLCCIAVVLSLSAHFLYGSRTNATSITTDSPPPILNTQSNTKKSSARPYLVSMPRTTDEPTVTQTKSLYLNLTQYPGEACNRICVAGQKRTCYFDFYLEHYQAMGVACRNCAKGVTTDCERPQCIIGDGVEKGVMSINRQVPGPPIHVCKGDRVIVDVTNLSGGTAASIHWHGMHMRATPWMDGVPYVTQCPIAYANTFRYDFTATSAGTQFYHSHSGHHKINGQYGAFIVREPAEDVNNAQAFDYDLPEHSILISDWMHAYAETLFPGLPSHQGIYPDSVLINGRGYYTNPQTLKRTSVPLTRYNVKPGKRYRIRLINSISHACPFKLQVEGHNMTVIASDGFDVEPRTFDTIVSNSGERYDFVINANHTEGDFWIRVRGMGVCEIRPTESVALLRYISNDVSVENDEPSLLKIPKFKDEYPAGIVFNHPNATCTPNGDEQCITALSAIDDDESLSGPPDQTFFLGFNNYPLANDELFQRGLYRHFANLESNLTIVGAINNITLIFPPYAPLTQPQDIVESDFCDESNKPAHCDNQRFCACIHRLVIPLGSLVELIIVDESAVVGRMHHPFHLHGHSFAVNALGQNPDGTPMTVRTAKLLERRRLLQRARVTGRPPIKDTVSIPSRGFARLRFRASNPGFWLMHCHYEWHLAIGMGLIVQVGRPAQMVPAPAGFPTCNNYQPKVKGE